MAALAAVGVEQPLRAPDVADLQCHHLGDPQAGAIGRQGCGAIAQIGDTLDQEFDIGFGNGPWQTGSVEPGRNLARER